jgi:type IV secretory pathway component VirB8
VCVCVVLCSVFRLIVVLFCGMYVVCVLCLIVVPLRPGENPFAVKINNNNNKTEPTSQGNSHILVKIYISQDISRLL